MPEGKRGGSNPGEYRGGRRKGTPNRKTAELQAFLDELGCNPLEGMALLAEDSKNSPELRGKMYAELAQYIYPKRKALEHSGPDGEAAQLVVTIRSVLDPPAKE